MNGRVMGVMGLVVVVGWVGLRAADPGAGAAATSVGGGAMPVGALVPFAGPGAAVPEAQGWLLCDGREVETRDFPELERVLGTSWGRASVPGRVRLPDLRGRFVRGVNGGAPGGEHDPEASARRASAPGGDEGDRVGTYQDDVTGPHQHPLMGVGDAIGAGAAGEWVRFFATRVPDETAPVLRNLAAVEMSAGVETRPRNVAVTWMIRAR